MSINIPEPQSPKHVRSARWSASIVVSSLVVAGLLLSACGSHPSTPKSTPKTAVSRTLAYDSCMRANGISNMPEPNAQGQMTITKGESLPDFNSPQFLAAAAKCRKLESAGGGSASLSPSQIGEQLKFAQCMRANGISNFPDPLSQGGFPLSGVNTSSSQFEVASTACERFGGVSGATSGG
jgi:hypothetical protein